MVRLKNRKSGWCDFNRSLKESNYAWSSDTESMTHDRSSVSGWPTLANPVQHLKWLHTGTHITRVYCGVSTQVLSGTKRTIIWRHDVDFCFIFYFQDDFRPSTKLLTSLEAENWGCFRGWTPFPEKWLRTKRELRNTSNTKWSRNNALIPGSQFLWGRRRLVPEVPSPISSKRVGA